MVVAHEGVPARFDRYVLTAGYNEVINSRQFGVTGLRWPTEYRRPDRTYCGELAVEVGGVAFALRHEKGETDDHTNTNLSGGISSMSSVLPTSAHERSHPEMLAHSRGPQVSWLRVVDVVWLP